MGLFLQEPARAVCPGVMSLMSITFVLYKLAVVFI